MKTAQTFAVNANNDMYVDINGNLAIVYDLQATLQACEQAAKTILGEMVLQIDQGIPYFQVVFVGSPDVNIFKAALKIAFLGVTGVLQVTSLTVQKAENTLNYVAEIQTVYGAGTING